MPPSVSTFLQLIFEEEYEESAIIISLVKKQTSKASGTDRTNRKTYLNYLKQCNLSI